MTEGIRLPFGAEGRSWKAPQQFPGTNKWRRTPSVNVHRRNKWQKENVSELLSLDSTEFGIRFCFTSLFLQNLTSSHSCLFLLSTTAVIYIMMKPCCSFWLLVLLPVLIEQLLLLHPDARLLATTA
ncbi:hypothetical protein OWV82_022064 [Melia azedarach]|uniref:Uncharacterized protein n=1 Tax=Melia azedarach TaxID=155640 RepID=A0ACC1X1E0_MELAZ|nr:hypothetical protein OWV82_022064 [Melia azedarach]